MKVQVITKNLNKASAVPTSTFNIIVSAADTALSLKEKIASQICLSCSKDQELTSNGKVIPDTERLLPFGISDGDTLQLTYLACEEVLVKQLSDLLPGKQAMSPEELGLLFTHRHGATIADALASLGQVEKSTPSGSLLAWKSLSAFLERQKCFAVEAGLVTRRESQSAVIAVAPAGPIKCHVTVELDGDSTEAKKTALLSDDEEDNTLVLDSSSPVGPTKELIAASLQVPWPEPELRLAGRKLEDAQSLQEAGVREGSRLVLAAKASAGALAMQLERLVKERTAISVSDLGLLYSQRHGATAAQALRTLGLRNSLSRFLESDSRFRLEGVCVSLAASPKLETPAPVCMEPIAEVEESLEYVLGLLTDNTFLNIARTEPSGRSGKEATVFVAGLPPIDRSRLLAGLQAPLAASLEGALEDKEGSVRMAGEEVLVSLSEASREMPWRLRLAAA